MVNREVLIVHAHAGDSRVVVACATFGHNRQGRPILALFDGDGDAVDGEVHTREHPRPVDHPISETVSHLATERCCGSLRNGLGSWTHGNL